jgi:hypothetical protein
MKHVLKVAIFATGILAFGLSHAQAQQDSSLGHKIGHVAKKVGHATAHAAASGVAAVKDKKYEGKCGPQGQAVYINENNKFYYVNKKGHRVYLQKSQLMDKPADKD